jgi:hypothetical protein
MAWGTRRDLAPSFAWKQVRLGFALKLVEARRRVLHVAPSWMLDEDQVEDGRVDATSCVRPFYSNFVVFYVLGSRGILVFLFLLYVEP